ncbi:hypothetical protein D6D15_08610 [Aureobasidium pullulans]|uniref:Uncharacterized protein n=1 Tax=Aureobasidium pullulans TaxID=5580 RepID=A0A4S9AXF9_AURPU|nr:hypothetical protein D6D15_08610 [Aureobasidium pullulans]
MCGQTIMVYECRCGHVAREKMPPRICKPACEIQQSPLAIQLYRPCQRCRNANAHMFPYLHRESANSTELRDKPLPGIPGLGLTEGPPPSYEHVCEQVPTYTRAAAEERPVAFDDVISALLNFDPNRVVSSWHAFRALQLSLLSPLCARVQELQRRITRIRPRVHRVEDIGQCDEIMIRLAREQKVLDTALQWGRRYLDAALVLKYGLDKSRDAAGQAARTGNHIEATSHVRAAAEHADKLLEVSIQLSRPGRQPQTLHTSIKTQLDVLQTVIQTLGSRATSRVWAFVQIVSRSNYEVHY